MTAKTVHGILDHLLESLLRATTRELHVTRIEAIAILMRKLAERYAAEEKADDE